MKEREKLVQYLSNTISGTCKQADEDMVMLCKYLKSDQVREIIDGTD